MNKFLKPLLWLLPAMLFTATGWAADPVATWTDFNALTSGNYTITKDAACTVNADGSITLGGAGLSVALATGQEIYDDNTITVVMDVSGVTNEGVLVSFTTSNQPIDLYYTGSKLRQRWATNDNKDTDYGNVDWTPARATIVFAYDGRGQTGTTTYVDGTKKMDTAGLRFTGTGSVMSSLTFPATTGMTIHSIRLYSSKLSATDAPIVSTALLADTNIEFNGNYNIVVKGSNAAWIPAGFNWNQPSSYVDTPTGKGFLVTDDGSIWPCSDAGNNNIPTDGDYTVALYANASNVADNATLWWIGHNTWQAGNAITLMKTDADTVSVRHVNGGTGTVYAEYTSDELTKDAYRLYVVTVDNEADTTTINLYVDGVKTAGTVTTKFTADKKIQIGNAVGNASQIGLNHAKGMLVDNFYGWNKALTDAEVAALTSVMTPIPAPATYVRTIDTNADWSATDAWTLDGTSTIAAVPAEGKDAKITTTADATLTVNAAADVNNFATAGAGTLTIASDGTNKLTAQKTQIEANTIVNAGAASLGATFIANGKTLIVKDMTTVSAISGTGVYNLDLGATTADGYTFAADGKNYKVSSGTFTNATLNFSATQTNYEFAGGDLTLTGNEGQFSFGTADVTISGGTINATHLVTVQGGGSRPTAIEQTGGNIILSGTGDGSNTQMDNQTIMFGHWPSATSSYLLSGGSLVAEEGGVRFGNDSPSAMTISATGLFKVKGIKGKGTTASALTITGGKLSLGDWGFDAINDFTFSAQGGEINAFGNATINQTIALDGNVTLSADAGKTLTIYTVTGSGTLTIAGEGTVALPEAVVKTIPVTVAKGATLKVIQVIPTVDALVLGKIVLAEGSTISGTVVVDGIENITTDGATISFTPDATITGSVWWWDYEFNGDFASIGADTTTMTADDNDYKSHTDDGQSLYFQRTPYRSAAFASQDAFTAVMYCQSGDLNNVPLVSFGTKDGLAVILATGANAANGEMQISLNRSNSLTSLADNLIVPNATTAKHFYAFTYDVQADKTVISVYVDGKLKKVTTINERLHVSDGFQIGSIYGGMVTGLSRYSDAGELNDGTIDFLRVAKGVLSAETMTALAKAYPYVSEKGIAQRTIADATANWVADAAWTQKVPDMDDAMQAAPNDGTNVELTATANTQVTVNLEADASYETLTIAGSDVTFVAGEAAKKIVAGDVTIDANVTIPYGVAEIGTLTVNTGKTLTFDFSAYDFASIWADRTISLTGLAVIAEEATVTAVMPELLPAQIQSATIAYNDTTQEYALKITVDSSALTGVISGDCTWDEISEWKIGETAVSKPSDWSLVQAVTLSGSGTVTLPEGGIALGTLTIAAGNITLAGGTLRASTKVVLDGGNVSASIAQLETPLIEGANGTETITLTVTGDVTRAMALSNCALVKDGSGTLTLNPNHVILDQVTATLRAGILKLSMGNSDPKIEATAFIYVDENGDGIADGALYNNGWVRSSSEITFNVPENVTGTAFVNDANGAYGSVSNFADATGETAAVKKTGSGVLQFGVMTYGVNQSYSGTTTVEAGTLAYVTKTGSVATLAGQIVGAGKVAILSGGVTFTSDENAFTGGLEIAEGGRLTVTQSGAMGTKGVVNNGALTFAFPAEGEGGSYTDAFSGTGDYTLASGSLSWKLSEKTTIGALNVTGGVLTVDATVSEKTLDITKDSSITNGTLLVAPSAEGSTRTGIGMGQNVTLTLGENAKLAFSGDGPCLRRETVAGQKVVAESTAVVYGGGGIEAEVELKAGAILDLYGYGYVADELDPGFTRTGKPLDIDGQLVLPSGDYDVITVRTPLSLYQFLTYNGEAIPDWMSRFTFTDAEGTPHTLVENNCYLYETSTTFTPEDAPEYVQYAYGFASVQSGSDEVQISPAAATDIANLVLGYLVGIANSQVVNGVTNPNVAECFEGFAIDLGDNWENMGDLVDNQIVTLSYDFGVSDITVAKRTVEATPSNWIAIAVQVTNGGGYSAENNMGGVQPAKLRAGTQIQLSKDDGDSYGETALTPLTDDELTAAGLVNGEGVYWYWAETLPEIATGKTSTTVKYKVRAVNDGTAPAQE